MSESATTTRTKSLSSDDTDSTDSPLIQDRWSNNISYRQLVVSSCIGIFQFCWHPYVHDLRRLLPFIVLNTISSLTIAYPTLYLELAVAAVAKKGVINCWDLAPMARGIGFAMLSCCMFTALAASALGARCLALLVHSLHTFLPWLHCAAGVKPPCAARHRPLTEGALTPAHSFYYNFVLDTKPDGLRGGLGSVVWELATYYAICWLLIYFIAIKRIYSYSKLVLFKDVLAFFVMLCCGVGVTRLDGASDVFRECDWTTVFDGLQMWREAIEYSLLEMSVSQGSLAMLGALCPTNHKLGPTALSALLVAKLVGVGNALILGAAFGALKKDYDGKPTLAGGSSSAIILWADLASRTPGSQFWSALLFFTLFVLALTTAALLIQTIMSSLSGRSLRRITWAFLVLICLLYCFIGIMTLCTQGGQYILDFILRWPVSLPRLPIAATMAVAVSYIYGQKGFCSSVYVSLQDYPNVWVRVCWALSPVVAAIIFAFGMGVWNPSDGLAGWLTAAVTVMPIALVVCMYTVFKCRVRNIVSSEK